MPPVTSEANSLYFIDNETIGISDPAGTKIAEGPRQGN